MIAIIQMLGILQYASVALGKATTGDFVFPESFALDLDLLSKKKMDNDYWS